MKSRISGENGLTLALFVAPWLYTRGLESTVQVFFAKLRKFCDDTNISIHPIMRCTQKFPKSVYIKTQLSSPRLAIRCCMSNAKSKIRPIRRNGYVTKFVSSWELTVFVVAEKLQTPVLRSLQAVPVQYHVEFLLWLIIYLQIFMLLLQNARRR